MLYCTRSCARKAEKKRRRLRDGPKLKPKRVSGKTKPPGRARSDRIRAVIDVETDPFKHGRVPEAFAAEYLDEAGRKVVTWGPECIFHLLREIADFPPALIYAHNGGRFDFHFFREWLSNPVKIFGGSIGRVRLGRHELQDSLKIIPVALAQSSGGKDEIAFKLFEAGRREKHKAKILRYLHRDCVSLLQWVVGFERRFGYHLSVGGAAMAELQKFHPQTWIKEGDDGTFRKYYQGGRVEAFEPGDHHGRFRCYDVRSMYPFVMHRYAHPIGAAGFDFIAGDLPGPGPRLRGCYFSHLTATSRGALPLLSDDGLKLEFPHGRHSFFAVGHEIEAALKFGLLDIEHVRCSWVPKETQSFSEFVFFWYAEKKRCREAGDGDGELHAKLVLNAASGKFAQNPANFCESTLVRSEEEREAADAKGYKLYQEGDFYEVWQRPLSQPWSVLMDVSIAASITSAARAVLLEAITRAKRPLYCDTDSIICEELPGVEDTGELGDWAPVAYDGHKVFSRVVIAGKKIYGLGYRKPGNRNWQWIVKSKGGRLTGPGLLAMLKGELVTYRREAPTFGPSLVPKPFIVRRFKQTSFAKGKGDESRV
jgi:hypothetical protein